MGAAAGPNIVEDGLVLYLDAANSQSYPGSGTTWSDLSGNGNDGTLVNGVGYSGDNNGSMVFDGGNDYVEIPNSSSLSPTNEITVSCIFNLTDLLENEYPSLVIKQDPGGNFGSSNYGLWCWRGGLAARGISFRTNLDTVSTSGFDGNRFIEVDANTLVNKWSMLVGTYNGTFMDLYLDDVFAARVNASGDLGNADTPVVIGRNGENDGQYVSSKISNIQIYNRALTEAEIKQNYNALKGRYGL